MDIDDPYLRHLLEHEIGHLLIRHERAKAEIEHDLLAFLDQLTDALENVRQSESQRLDVNVRGELQTRVKGNNSHNESKGIR